MDAQTAAANLARLDQLEQTLEAFAENARQMAVITANFQDSSQDALNHKLHTLITGLQELDAQKHQLGDISVPIELLDRLDRGENPQLYTKDVVDRTEQRNKELNGKLELYKKFRATLLSELHTEMPRETMQYRMIRERGGAVPLTNPVQSDERSALNK